MGLLLTLLLNVATFGAHTFDGVKITNYKIHTDTAEITGQTVWSEYPEDITINDDSAKFINTDTVTFSIGFPWKLYNSLQKIDSVLFTFACTVDTDTLAKCFLDTLSTTATNSSAAVDSFTTKTVTTTYNTVKIISMHNILDNIYRLRVLTLGTGTIYGIKLKYFTSAQ